MGGHQAGRQAGGLEAGRDVLPVHQVPPGLDVVGLDVEVIQVEGVLPHVDHEQRHGRDRDVALLVGHLVGHEALADGVPREDGPAGALQAQGSGGELSLEGLKGAEELVDGGTELALGARGALAGHVGPEDGVVGEASKQEVYTLELLMKQAKVSVNDRRVVTVAKQVAEERKCAVIALELADGRIVTGKTTDLLGPASAVLLNAIKELGGIADEMHLISPTYINPIQNLKTRYLGSSNPRLHMDEVLIALSMCAATDSLAKLALEKLPELKGCQAHSTVMLTEGDFKVFKKLGVELTNDPIYETK